MAKNQKRETVELRWQRLVAVIGLVACIAGLTVGYVLQRRAHDELGQQIKAVEREIGWITDRVKEGREQVERCRRKDVLIGRATQMALGLTDIVSSQRLTVPLLENYSTTRSMVTLPPAPVNSAPTFELVASGAVVAPQVTQR